MRRIRAVLATVALAGATFAVAGPASADHVADILEGGTVCRMGGLASGIGVDLRTTTFHVTEVRGVVKGYSCFFADTPERVTADDNGWGMEWTRPTDKPYVVTGFECWPGDTDGPDPVPTRSSSFMVTPSGRAVLNCRF